MHEIVTLQFGNQSNYLGTHFWNTQESYFTYSGENESPVDHDIHFRAGIGADGSDTFTPRTVIYDLKDNFGTLRQVNALYELQQEADLPSNLWNGNPIIQQRPIIPPHEYQVHLDSGLPPPPLSASTVRFWSDYNRVFYHPRSLVQLHVPISHIPQASPQTPLSPFDRWDVGEDLFQTEDQEHDLLDRDLRPFVEECDQMQGFQVIAGADDAWAGFAGKYVERIRDEFGRKSVWVWGLEDGRDAAREKRLQQLVNTARAFQTLASQASLYIPVSNVPGRQALPYISLDVNSIWQTSALQASALESVSLPTRLRTTADVNRGIMSDIEALFTNEANRNILQLELSAKDPATLEGHEVNGTTDHRMANGATNYDDDAPSEPKNLDISFFHKTSPSSTRLSQTSHRAHTFSHIEVLRGPWPPTHDPEDMDTDRRPRPSAYQALNQEYRSQLLYPLPSSYPSIFRFPQHNAAEGLAVQTALSASTGVADRIRDLATVVGRVVGVEEREGLRDELLTRAGEYVEGWDGGSDSDDDE